ncbi:MAG: hypothetical protein LBV33_06465 [Lachnospiraceae bacterium]|jgi:hypothetical protein|nr:hypothetical protein [Lachnospiraceae bacterium]
MEEIEALYTRIAIMDSGGIKGWERRPLFKRTEKREGKRGYDRLKIREEVFYGFI